MAYLTPPTGYLILVVYGLFMILITYFFARWKRYRSIQGFLVAERNVKWWLGATSIAASWIVGASLFIIAITTLSCLLMPRKTPWKALNKDNL
ncbi:MAG TPA: hypothetical protein VJG90_03065 [Candidatus Nanoarchaeia archaeon]|nr:hypothetical protein [Candidatus Nanoarchaeia archaeon]